MYKLLILILLISCSKYEKESFLKNKENLIVSQDGQWWCAFASTESIYKHFNKNVPQEESLKKAYNLEYITPEVYMLPFGIRKDHDLLFQSIFLGNDGIDSKIADIKNVPTFIDLNMPVLIMYDTKYSGHVSVIVGYRKYKGNYEYQLMDPAYKTNKTSPFVWKKLEEINELKYYNERRPSSLFVMFKKSDREKIEHLY